ncbi:hypothetical protein FHP26_04200 [Pseudomonas orientalis]|nr:hypothetical protein [Pseudomonas orientalis]
MLAKHSWTPRTSREHALSLRFFASKLAPTKKCAVTRSTSFVAFSYELLQSWHPCCTFPW